MAGLASLSSHLANRSIRNPKMSACGLIKNVSYLIKVLEKINGKKRGFEEAKEDVQNHLRELREQRLLNDWYETQIEAATIEHLREKSQDGR
jgi:hypothetical protein